MNCYTRENVVVRNFGWSLLALCIPRLVQAGVVADAPPLINGLTNILNFLLLIFGVIGILGLIVAGVLYFTALGDERQVMLAKKAVWSGVIGIVIALGSLILVLTLARLLA